MVDLMITFRAQPLLGRFQHLRTGRHRVPAVGADQQQFFLDAERPLSHPTSLLDPTLWFDHGRCGYLPNVTVLSESHGRRHATTGRIDATVRIDGGER
jgi:hypothetical protein